MEHKVAGKQFFLFTLINYFGIGLGFVSTFFIYPWDKETLGIFSFVDSCAQLLYPLLVLGGAQALIHFSPLLEERVQKQLFNYSLYSILCIGSGVLGVLLLAYAFVPWESMHYVLWSFPIGLCLAMVELYKRQATTMQRLAVPTVFEKIIPKLSLPLFFIGIVYLGWQQSVGLLGFVLSFVLMICGIVWYMQAHYQPGYVRDFKLLFEKLSKKEYYKYSLYAFAGSFGSFFAFRIDGLMIPPFLGFEANGTFKIAVNLANTLAIPATGLFALYAPIISDLLKKGQLLDLEVKYKEVATIVLAIGGLFYGAVVLGIHPLLELLPTKSNLEPAVPVMLILGASMLVNMATSFNSEIISFSAHYRFNLIAILFLMVFNVSITYFFLSSTSLGIVGVGIATFLSMFLFNVLKTVYIYVKMGMHPFSWSYLYLVGILLGVGFGVHLIPDFGSWLLNLVVKSGGFILISALLIYWTNVIPVVRTYLKSKW